MTTINIPSREDVSEGNQAIFDNLQKAVGFVPNVYAALALSESALENYLKLQNAKTSFSKPEKEAISLVVSQVNGCTYCQSAHTMLGKMNGYTEEQILELRGGNASWDNKLDALVKLTKSIVENKGNAENITVENFLGAGYQVAQLPDLIIAVADKTVTNYISKLIKYDNDFPKAQSL